MHSPALGRRSYSTPHESVLIRTGGLVSGDPAGVDPMGVILVFLATPELDPPFCRDPQRTPSIRATYYGSENRPRKDTHPSRLLA